jgi:hypothetical protein
MQTPPGVGPGPTSGVGRGPAPGMGPVEARMAALARRQHGIVNRRQLLGLGVTKEEIDGRVRSGGLHLIHRGVYAVGHTAITVRGRWMAAVLASGDGAVLSHRSATALWGIWGSGAGEVHVTVPRKLRSRGSIRRHFGVLAGDERAVLDGIPVTSAARSVLDLAAGKGEAAAETALREMEYLGIYGPVSLPQLLERYPRHRGTPDRRGLPRTPPRRPRRSRPEPPRGSLPPLPRRPRHPKTEAERLAHRR